MLVILYIGNGKQKQKITSREIRFREIMGESKIMEMGRRPSLQLVSDGVDL
jgi:hypothetical protein